VSIAAQNSYLWLEGDFLITIQELIGNGTAEFAVTAATSYKYSFKDVLTYVE